MHRELLNKCPEHTLMMPTTSLGTTRDLNEKKRRCFFIGGPLLGGVALAIILNF
jgi:hypothetical protein